MNQLANNQQQAGKRNNESRAEQWNSDCAAASKGHPHEEQAKDTAAGKDLREGHFSRLSSKGEDHKEKRDDEGHADQASAHRHRPFTSAVHAVHKNGETSNKGYQNGTFEHSGSVSKERGQPLRLAHAAAP